MKAKENWKPVTISGFTGIMLGAGAMYGTQKLMTGEEDDVVEAEEQSNVAAVHDDMSFKEAFEAARAELGPGGVFHWHGGIYGTYYADEWNAMSAEEKEQFAQSVQQGTATTAEEGTNQMAEATVVEEEDNANNLAYTAAEAEEEEVASVTVVDEATTAAVDNTDDDDVRVIGYGDVDLADGSSVTVEELEINGQRVAVIDVDKDGVGDFAMSDINHNNRPDEGEVIDLHTGNAVSFEDQASIDDAESVIDIMPA